jgi:uncharacterized repeat protein (TIGR01451 family)
MNLIHSKNWLTTAKKTACSVVAFSLLFTQVFSASVLAAVIDPADPPNDPVVVYDLIAVVVDRELDQNTSSYQGLRSEYSSELDSFTAKVNGSNLTFSGLTLSERIMRYAEDLRASNNLTDVKIIFYDKEAETVDDLALALENLYLNNRLVGAVFVGDVPMPVVNKNGNQFMSMFPYTDFQDKTYIYNSETKSFEMNPDNIFPKPEIWHGIINSTNEDLAEYFDKNHLYYSGVPEFADFDKKLFFADMKNEEEGMNAEMFSRYNDYLDAAEDLTYMRYNKFWADSLTAETMEDLTFNEEDPDGAAFKETMENLDLTESIPDIFTKNIIDQSYASYYEVFGNFISKTNDFVDGTGRYTVADYDSMPILITVKDEYNRYYLKAVNDAIERAVNEVVEEIEDPLPLLKKTQMTGEFDDTFGTDFGVAVSSPLLTIPPPALPLGWKMEEIYYRYHYYNEFLNELYVNGIAAEDMENAKQCSIFLGSTRDDLDGDYSILVTASRVDNQSTAAMVPTAGVTTRTLTTAEAFSLTGGGASNGAVVEGSEYGMPAFILNDLFGDGDGYMSSFQKDLAEGDVITKVNGMDIDSTNPFDLAISNSYEWVLSIMEVANSDAYTDDERLELFSEGLPYEVRVAPGDSINGENAKIAAGVIEIEFYRSGQKYSNNYTFSVHEDKFTTTADPEGNPEMAVIMSPSVSASAYDSQGDFDGSGNWSDGAIFSLYNTEKRGFENEGYDASAGCNANSTQYYDDATKTTYYNEDRCFPFLASMPVLDPAGAVNVRTATEPTHPYLFEAPDNLEDIDETIYDGCYFGMPGLESLSTDGNPYTFPLDPTERTVVDYAMDQDYYGTLLDGVGEFIGNTDGSGSNSAKATSLSDDWSNIDDLGVSDVVLNNYLLTDKVTLKHFSDRYGLFDGIDNDGDGIRDHYWTDTDNDGVYETKVYDAEEADTIYGLDSKNLPEIARKMLSHNSTFILPSSLSPFDDELTLTVAVDQEKEISSMILHNEPTAYTITEQLKSMSAMDLPIDNPRYVAFMSDPVPLPTYPGVTEVPHYFPGDIEKIYYPNLFDYSNFAELEVALDQLAWDIVMVPGSYKIDSGSPSVDCRIPADNFTECKALHDVVMETYFDPVVGFSGDSDSPDDFNIEEASVKKVYDSLEWNGLNIDQKHEYVLEKYLNDGENAFVGDGTLFPAPNGYTIASGYEAAYLVLDGDGDSFDMKFNKDFQVDDDEKFDPLESIETQEERDAKEAAGELDEEEEDEFEFVWLDQFLAETVAFITGFAQPPEFKDCCGSSEEQSEIRDAEENGSKKPGPETSTYKAALLSDQPLDQLVLSVDKETINAGSLDNLLVDVSGYDSGGELVGPVSGNPLITLVVLQSDDSPLLTNASYSDRAFSSGVAKFELTTTGETGNVVVYAESSDGLTSNSVPVKVTTRDVQFSSFTYYVPDVEALNTYLDEEGIGSEVESEEVVIVEEADWEDETLDFVLDNVDDFGGDGSGDDDGDDAEDDGGGVVRDDGSGDDDESILIGADVEEELEEILSEIPVEEEVVEEIVVGEEEEVGDDDGDDDDSAEEVQPDIRILESELVEETTLYSTTIEEDVGDDVADDDDDDGGAEDTEEAVGNWQDYYLDTDYYKKYLDSDLEVYRSSRLMVELFSDRMIAYIPDEENPFVDAVENEDTQYWVGTSDQMVADGESLMMVTVAIFDEEGNLVSDNKTVRFSIIDSVVTDIVAFENGDTATTEDGEATVYLKAGTKTGAFKVRAEVLDSGGSLDAQYPLREKQLYLVAGEPILLSIGTDSCDSDILDPCMMVANGEFKSEMKISIRDKFGNLANNSFAQVALFAGEGVYFDPNADTNGQILGTQIGTLEGEAMLDIYAENQPGSSNVIAVLLDYELEEEFILLGDDWEEIDFTQYAGTSRTFELLESVELDIDLNKTAIGVDGEVMQIETTLMSGGQVVDNYSGPIEFTLLSDQLGAFVQTPSSKMVDGVLIGNNVKFESSEMAGVAEILVEIPGAVSDTVSFDVLPSSPAKLELVSSEERIYSDGVEEVVLEARILDKFGNLVNTSEGTGIVINFGTTPATQGYVDFLTAQSAISLEGIATVRVAGGDISGIANIVAVTATIDDPAVLSLEIVKHFDAAMIENFAPRTLYMSLLGGAFGKLGSEKNMAEVLLYSEGQIQSISSVTAGTSDNERLFGVDPYGKLDVLADSVNAEVVLATDSFPYQKIVISDEIDGEQLATVFMVPDPNTSLILLEEGVADDTGIYVENISTTEPDMVFEERDDGIYMVKDGETKAVIDKFGRISLNDKSYELTLVEESSNLTFAIENKVEKLAIISFDQDFGKDVQYKAYDDSLSASFAGVYMQVNTLSSQYKTVQKYSRSSTNDPLGFYLVDLENEIDAGQSPFMEDSFGVGFDGNNKHMLFFSAGSSVGESHIPYGSEAMVIYGDPNVRLKIEGIVGMVSIITGYTKTIGQSIFAGEEDIVEMIPFEYNGDSLDDILLVYKDGRIRLLEHEISNRHFTDRGYILNAFGGAVSAVAIDANNDGYDDLVLGNTEACVEGDQPVSLYTNMNGHFERESLNLDIEGEVSEIKADDMNSDGCTDLVVSDSAGNIRVFYNTNDGDVCTGLETDFGYEKSFGYEIDSTENLVENLFIHYSGVTIPLDQYGLPINEYITFVLRSDTPPASVEEGAEFADSVADLYDTLGSSDDIAELDLPPLTYPKEYALIHILDDPDFGLNSTKQAIDVNGGTIAKGDKINYVITLENNSGSNVSDMIVSDFTPVNMTLDLESLECLDSGCSDELEWEETEVSSRSRVIRGISVPAGGKRTIMYSMILGDTPEIHFDLGDFDSQYFSDVLVKPSYNPEGTLTYLYSKVNLSSRGYNNYDVTPVSSTGYDMSDDLPIDLDALSAIDPENPKIPPDLKQQITSMTYPYDSDGDGCPDSWAGGLTEAQSAADAVANSVESAIKTLRCGGGGCLPIPYNYAFFAADDAVPGLPVFSLGHTWPGGIGAFLPTTSFPSTFRLYLSPTLTLGLGTAICTGPSSGHQAPCFAFSIPLAEALGVCDAIQGPINDAIATATNSVSNPDIGMSTVVSDGSGGADTGTTSGNFAYSNSTSPVNAAGAYNVKIPGFPGVITNWLDKQTDEIYNKLLDFPTFYFIYPDFKTMVPDSATFGANFSQIKNQYDFLRVINSIPLVQVEGKEVVIQIPAISKSEAEKWKRQAEAWLKYEKSEIKRFTDHYKCDNETDPTRKSICDKFVLNMKDLTQSVEQIMTTVDQISNLPRDILNWKTMESKYASQIICWLDAIMEFTGGYIKRQSKIIKSWVKASEDAVKTFKDWKVVLDLAAEYQKSCDQCKNDRFSKLSIMMQLFAAIPEPPIIPLPKWPDVVVDVSQLKAGIKVIWPDLKFKPQSVRLPNLPYFTFPTDFTPDFIMEMPSIPIPDWMKNFPEFVIPNLPDLPSLQVPKLPDLPRPPKIPKLPQPVVKLATNLKAIFKILCLLKKGMIPIPEGKLATEIETLTQSSVKAALPIIGKLGIQVPPVKYDFVEQIRITVKLDIGLDLSTIYLVTKAGADLLNNGVKTMIDTINEFLKFDVQTPINNAVKAAENSLKAGVNAAVEKAAEEAAEAAEKAKEEAGDITLDGYEQIVFDEMKYQFEEMNNVLNDYIDAMEVEDLPDTYYLTATPEYLDPSDPMMNRTIEEIELDILTEDLPDDPEIQRLAMMRDSLIEYTKNLNSTNDALMNAVDDYDEFTRILVDNDEDITRQLASTSIPFEGEPEIKKAAFDLFDGELIAADFDPLEAMGDLIDGGEPAAAPVGFYVAANGQNESVLNYVAELGRTVHTSFSDVDGDEDFDIIYSMGGDVYLKENYTSTNAVNAYLGEGDVILTTTLSSVSDFVPEGGASVQGVTSPYENNNKADVNWTEVAGAVSYEILIKRSLLHSDADAAFTYTVEAPANSYSIEDIENGNYYAVVYAINADGVRSLVSNNSIVAPQMCADRDAPFPAVTRDSFELSIFKELEIDASGSFDTSGEVTEFYLEGGGATYWSDLNTALDTDGDGIVWNDRNNPIFKLGPFDEKSDVGLLQFILNVADQSGHTSTQEIDVSVFVPAISLDQTFSRSYEATGVTLPAVDYLPFSILRSRYIYRSVDDELFVFPRIEKIETQSADSNGKYLTQGDGSYSVTDFDLEDMILVENSAGEIIAEIHPETGNVGAVENGYNAVANEAVPPTSPTSVSIEDDDGSWLASVYLIADPNQDVNIYEEVYFDAENFEEYDGVNVSDVDLGDDFVFEGISASDPYYPGGAAFVHVGEEKPLLFIDPAGNLLIVDERVTIRLKDNDHYVDPLVIEVLFEGDVVAEVYISVHYEDMLIVGPNDVPYATPRAPSASIFYAYGDRAALDPDFVPEELVKRKEFVKVLLDMLCIIPRPEAYDAYSGSEGESGGGFYDLPWNSNQLPEYYEHIKEADLLGLIYGYTGETDPATGLHPFKPDNTITRAEATNIILEALEFVGVLNLDDLSIGSPWYVPIIEAGQDMTPYINPGYNLKSNFIITAEEALEPNKEMTHEELTIMVERVLELYSCYELDADNDGMSDFCELKYGIDEPYEDEDNDEMLNTNECFYLTDPTNPDTDGGGMIDGREMKFNTNPLNPDDDPDDSDGDGCTDLSELLVHGTDPNDPDTDDGGVNDCVEATENLTDPLVGSDDQEKGEYSEAEPGLYIVPANCNTCPCASTLLHKADLIPGDIIFTVISTYEEEYIFSKSNEVTIQ